MIENTIFARSAKYLEDLVQRDEDLIGSVGSTGLAELDQHEIVDLAHLLGAMRDGTGRLVHEIVESQLAQLLVHIRGKLSRLEALPDMIALHVSNIDQSDSERNELGG